MILVRVTGRAGYWVHCSGLLNAMQNTVFSYLKKTSLSFACVQGGRLALKCLWKLQTRVFLGWRKEKKSHIFIHFSISYFVLNLSITTWGAGYCVVLTWCCSRMPPNICLEVGRSVFPCCHPVHCLHCLPLTWAFSCAETPHRCPVPSCLIC